MNKQRIQELRKELDNESLSYDDIVDIESAFAEIPDEQLRDLRENAMVGDMLDELEVQNSSDELKTSDNKCFTVFVDGQEVNDNYLTLEQAKEYHKDYTQDGYEPYIHKTIFGKDGKVLEYTHIEQDTDKEYFDDYASKDSESMQERADEFRKDDSEPEQEYWFDVTVDQSSVVASSLEEAERKIKEVIALGVDYEVYEISEVEL